MQTNLSGVSRTLLWTLTVRAKAARLGLIQDPLAMELVAGIEDNPLASRPVPRLVVRRQARRTQIFDAAVAEFLTLHPDGTVVALAEGLETQMWRVGASVPWISVDLPDVTALRASLLPHAENATLLPASALEETWMEEAARHSGPLLVVIQGLLMYLQPLEVHTLLGDTFARFPSATLLIDGVSPLVAYLSQHLSPDGERTPPMPWSLSAKEMDFLTSLPASLERLDVQDRSLRVRPPRPDPFGLSVLRLSGSSSLR